MRLLNIFAALSGVLALGMLVLAAHALQPTPEDLERIKLAAYLQLGAAGAGLAIANRSGRLNLIAGAMILLGAAISPERFARLPSPTAAASSCSPLSGE